MKEVGEATKALSAMKVGDVLGVRGPYGRGFARPTGRDLCVGGGVGIARHDRGGGLGDRRTVDVAIGARNAGEIVFEERARPRPTTSGSPPTTGATASRGPRSRWPRR